MATPKVLRAEIVSHAGAPLHRIESSDGRVYREYDGQYWAQVDKRLVRLNPKRSARLTAAIRAAIAAI